MFSKSVDFPFKLEKNRFLNFWPKNELLGCINWFDPFVFGNFVRQHLKGMWSDWTTWAKMMLIIIKIDNMSLIFCCFVLVKINLTNKNLNSNHIVSWFSHWYVISIGILRLQLTKISIDFHTLVTIQTSTSASKATIFFSSSNINKQDITLQLYA